MIKFRKLITTAALCLSLGGLSTNRCPAQIESIAEVPVVAETPQPAVWEISPAAEPSPALKYTLWPDRIQLVEGNAMVPIQRALVLMLDRSNRPQLSKQQTDHWDAWFEGPLDQLPKEEVRQFLAEYKFALSELHRAEFMRHSHYDMSLDALRGVEVVSFLLPEVQQMRELGRLLCLETRLALAEGRTEDALRSLRVAMRLSDSAGNSGDLIICKLVGIAIAGINLEQVSVAMGQPDMPNMYWALASIPDSIYETRNAMVFEANILERVFPSLVNLPEEKIEASAWRERINQAIENFVQIQNFTSGNDSVGAKMATGFYLLARHEMAREELIASGFAPERVAEMSAAEAVVRATSASLQRTQDDFAKWNRLPKGMRQQGIQAMDNFFKQKQANGSSFDIATILASQLMPASSAVMQAELRCEQSIARLVTVEAIRDFAARTGRLPQTLAEVTHLLPWNDPIAVAPFGYKALSETEATLTGAPRHNGDKDTTILLRLKKISAP